MVINTGIKATPKFREILGSVIGQMSDGIWENTRSMEKYWKSLRYDVDPAGYIIIEDRHYVCSNPVEFFANKIKQIVKIEAEDKPSYDIQWSRSCSAVTTYLNYYETITIGDCYELYELLKGRNTTKYSYASYEPYRVNLEYAGVSFDITVEALNQSDAKAKAIKKFAEQAACTIYK
jgi:hypothetical protein